jgi:hypothetical protein
MWVQQYFFFFGVGYHGDIKIMKNNSTVSSSAPLSEPNR